MKQEDKLIVKIQLDKKFMQNLRGIMEYELDEAGDKWEIDLTQEQKDIVVDNAFSQLIDKVGTNANIKWDLGEELEVKITGMVGNLTLPSEGSKHKNTRVLKTRTGWAVSTDPEDEAIMLADFKEHYENLVITWAKTAIFYGVGSFAA